MNQRSSVLQSHKPKLRLEEAKQILTMREHPAASITVFGASVDAVNGTYALIGKRTDMKGTSYPFYEKIGQLGGRGVSFELVRLPADRRHAVRWTISCGTELSFYICYGTPFDDMPPTRGWWPLQDLFGNLPILFHGDDKVLDWRHAPDESYSDYKLEFCYEENGVVAIREYHCHKVILASASKYFDGLFSAANKEGQGYVEDSQNMSRIELDAKTAFCVPMLLDYMYLHYSKGGAEAMFKAVCFAGTPYLYWLADYFQVSRLAQNIRYSWTHCMREEDCAELLRVALPRGIHPVVEAVLAFLKNNCERLKGDRLDELVTELVAASDLSTLMKLLELTKSVPQTILRPSQIVALFCKTHTVDKELFGLLTSVQSLPTVAKEAAWPLLEKERELHGGETFVTSISSLQERCLDVLAQDLVCLETGADSPLRAQSMLFVCKLIEKYQQQQKQKQAEDAKTLCSGEKIRRVRKRLL
ncbi:hypothetical protein MPSEU_000987000 [Mayamaea pseudoterrestris]|nr:hypothetical protein MPSEU_000987000 [Mayamaea pseudoterrestris]